MARIRTIKPTFWTDGKTGTLSDRAKLLFLGMLNFSDDLGFLKFDLGELKARIFPYIYESPLDVVGKPLIDELVQKGLVLVVRRENENGDGVGGYLHIVNFSKHQKIDRPGPPLIEGLLEKDIEKLLEKSNQIPQFDEYSTSPREKFPRKGREGKGREWKGKEEIIAPSPSVSEPPVLVFPTHGKEKTWGLTQSTIDSLKADFPALDVMAQCRAARAWCEANAMKRKTVGGMPRFLAGWMARQQNRGGNNATVKKFTVAELTQ